VSYPDCITAPPIDKLLLTDPRCMRSEARAAAAIVEVDGLVDEITRLLNARSSQLPAHMAKEDSSGAEAVNA